VTLEGWLDLPQDVATRLRALRAEAGLSGQQLAQAAGWAQSKVSRIETGRQAPTDDDIAAWVTACRGSSELATALQDLQARARVAGAVDFRESMARGQAAQQENYDRLFGRAQLIQDFETVYMPGLLQIPEYARRVRREMVPLHDLALDDSDAAVARRINQQQNLYDPTKRFEFLIAEPALRYLLVPPSVMRWQLDRLQAVIGMDRVRLGIIPMGVVLKWTPQHSFQIYHADAPIVEVESVVKGMWYRGDDAIRFVRFFEWLWEDALEGDHARRLIADALAALSTGPISRGGHAEPPG
jgi:transcriptional regulator with XRE-family HTH domain